MTHSTNRLQNRSACVYPAPGYYCCLAYAAAVWLAAALFLALPALADTGQQYDLVINNGRVMDPASGLDAVRSLGIKDGRLVNISETALRGTQNIDAKGAIVGPGFIDYHAHGGSLLSGRLQAFDGVTTSIEAEMGQLPVAAVYARAQQEGRVSNYGWTVNWALARMQVLGGIQPDGTIETLGRGMRRGQWNGKASPEQARDILALIDNGLEEGGLGIGLTLGYASSTRHTEIQALSHLAAEHGVPIMTHARFWGEADPGGDIAATQEIIANAITTGAHWYMCHISLASVDRIQTMVAAAREHGAHIDVEALVSETGSTFLGAEFLAPEALPYYSRGFTPQDILYYGRPIADEAQLRRLRQQDPGALVFLLHRDSVNNLQHRATQRKSFELPGTILASDGMPWQDRQGRFIAGDAWPLPEDAWAHPRSQATYTRFLQLWVREWHEFTVMDAFRLGSYNPARALEAAVPQMKRKGRIAVGADADLVIFKLADIQVNASLQNPLGHTTGMRYVIVNGTPVIVEGELDLSVRPGQAIRRATASSEQ